MRKVVETLVDRIVMVNTLKEFGKNQLKVVKLKKGDVVFRSSDEGLIAIIWKDKNDVRILSTMHTSGMKDTGKNERNGDPRLKPHCVQTYNGGMGGVDASDQMAATYRFVLKICEVVQEALLLPLGYSCPEFIPLVQGGWRFREVLGIQEALATGTCSIRNE